MALPVKPLPTSNLGGITFRSLTMREAKAFRDLTPEGESPDMEKVSAYVIATATDSTSAEVDAYLDGTSFGDANRLVSAILILSGLAEEDADTDPKLGGSEPS